MARTSVEDPLKTFRFVVFIDGFAKAGFKECSGLERTTEVVEYREGGDNETVRKSAGLSSFSDITLTKGQIVDQGQNDFLDWATEVYETTTLAGAARDYRRDIEIVQYERGGVEGARWRVHNCFPIRFKPFGDLDAQGSEDSIEELTVANEGFEKVAI